MISLLDKYNVRVFQQDNKVWFSARDVESALGLTYLTRNLLKQQNGVFNYGVTDKDCKIVKNSDVYDIHIRNFDKKLNNRGEKFLTSKGIYKVTFRSNTETALEFTDWVADVIDNIRENGYYILGEQDRKKWFEARKESKFARRQETDQIKEFVEYARSQGSENPEKYYIIFTNLANKKVGINSKERDNLSQEDLLELKSIETLIKRKIKQGIEKQLHYKEIYKHVKEFIDMV